MNIKFIFILSFILNILIADSPITSTDFYKAYLSIPEVESARSIGIINEQIANFLLNAEHTIDKKAAVINALSWDLNGKVNAILFNKYLYKKYNYIENPDSLIHIYTDSELFCLGYLTVMDNYHKPEKGLIFFDSIKSSLKHSYTVKLIYALTKSQILLSNLDRWCEVWTNIEKVKNNKNLDVDMKLEARNIIFKYMKGYEKYCSSDGSKKI